MERSNHEKRIEAEIAWCYTFEPGQKCRGASGRKLRQVCIWCPNYRNMDKEKKREEKP